MGERLVYLLSTSTRDKSRYVIRHLHELIWLVRRRTTLIFLLLFVRLEYTFE
jgi:hypothetical protein